MVSADALVGAVTLGVAGLLYLTPSLVGARRDVDVLARLLQLNVFIGWTLIGWVYCLLLAVRQPPRVLSRTGEVRRDDRAWRSVVGRTAPFVIGRG